MRTLGILLLTALALPTLAACDEDNATGLPTEAEVSGSYEATTLTFQAAGGAEVDALAEGAYIEVDLDADGTTTGTYFVPGGNEDGSDYTADLTGTWTLIADRVRFDHDADTFIRDVVFTYEDGRLVSESESVSVVLTRD